MNAAVKALLVVLALDGIAHAQVSPIVNIEMTPKQIEVGQPIELRITVLVPTWFSQPPRFPSFELTNVITRLPADSSYPTSETVNGDTWSGIVRHYQVFPLMGATYRLDNQLMIVTFADPKTREPIKTRVPIPPIEFRASVPPGAEQLQPYLAGRQLTVTRDVEGDVGSLAAGDAVVVRYTTVLDGMPAIFLPPLIDHIKLPGVSTYADEPIVQDDAQARRMETMTLVFASGGDFTLPAIELNWWSTNTLEVETATVPALTLTVDGPKLDASEVVSDAPRWSLIATTVALAIATLVASVCLIPRGVTRYKKARQRRQQSESVAFSRLRKALVANELHTAHRTLLRWLNRAAPGISARQFARAYGDAELEKHIEQLNRALYFSTAKTTDLRSLEKALVKARHRYRNNTARLDSQTALPALNP